VTIFMDSKKSEVSYVLPFVFEFQRAVMSGIMSCRGRGFDQSVCDRVCEECADLCCIWGCGQWEGLLYRWYVHECMHMCNGKGYV